MSNPRDFFENSVKPSYQAWLDDPLTEWKAKAATSNADTMAERICKYWNEKDQNSTGRSEVGIPVQNTLEGERLPRFRFGLGCTMTVISM